MQSHYNTNNPPPPRPRKPRLSLRTVFLAAAIGIGANALMSKPAEPPPQKVTYSEFLDKVKTHEVKDVVITTDTIEGKIIDPSNPEKSKKFYTIIPKNENVTDRLVGSGVKFEAQDTRPGPFAFLGSLLWLLLPMGLFIGFYYLMMKKTMGGGAGGIGGLGKSRAKLLQPETGKRITFKDVAGVDEAKEDLKEMVDFLKNPKKYAHLNSKVPKGALLVGPPGTGKTYLARAMAGEAGVPFYSASGSDFVEMFVGLGAARVRSTFEEAKKNAPCIIFIDEIDAVGRQRGSGLGAGNDEREQTLNQLLVEMDGFDSNNGIIILAATNRPDVLDPALVRPGRFDRQVVVPLPDLNGREKILQIHAAGKQLAKSVDLRVVARGTPGFSGADLANLVNEAALLAIRNDRQMVSMADFENAKDKILMGAERRTLAMTEEEKKLTAYHEAGHALLAVMQPHSDPIHKATIIPRGRALGMVMRLPEGDRVSMSRARLKADLAVAMAGRVAEEMVFGAEKITTGASSDIQMATDIATRMVMEWGMSEKLGMRRFSQKERESYLGLAAGQTSGLSEETARLVDQEINAILKEAYDTAKKTMTDHNDAFERIAQALIQYETLTGEEIKAVAKGLPIIRTPEVPNTESSGQDVSMPPPSAAKKPDFPAPPAP